MSTIVGKFISFVENLYLGEIHDEKEIRGSVESTPSFEEMHLGCGRP